MIKNVMDVNYLQNNIKADYKDNSLISGYSINDYLQNNIKTNYNYNPFVVINNYIINDIIPRNNNLVECTLFEEDEYGDLTHDFYIRITGNLSFSEEKQLRKYIYDEIKKYVNDLDYFNEFSEISIFLIR